MYFANVDDFILGLASSLPVWLPDNLLPSSGLHSFALCDFQQVPIRGLFLLAVTQVSSPTAVSAIIASSNWYFHRFAGSGLASSPALDSSNLLSSHASSVKGNAKNFERFAIRFHKGICLGETC